MIGLEQNEAYFDFQGSVHVAFVLRSLKMDTCGP
jgi:hypothetical protein